MKHLPDYRTDKNFKHLSMEDLELEDTGVITYDRI